MPSPREAPGNLPLPQTRQRVWSVGDFSFRESLKTIGGGNAVLVDAAPDRVLLVMQCTGGGPASVSTKGSATPNFDGFLVSLGSVPWELRVRDHPGVVQAEWWLLGGGAGNVSVLEVFYRPSR